MRVVARILCLVALVWASILSPGKSIADLASDSAAVSWIAAPGSVQGAAPGSRQATGSRPAELGDVQAAAPGSRQSAAPGSRAAALGNVQAADLSEPLNTHLVGHWTPSDQASAEDVAIAGPYAYVAGGSSGLIVLDVSNPATPTEIGSFQTSSSVFRVAISGNIACVIGNDTLYLIDVSDPAHPAESGSLSWQIGSFGLYAVKISGQHAYVADYFLLRVVDLSDPAHPTEVGSTYGNMEDVYGGDMAMSGRYVYLATPGDGAVSVGLEIIDVSDPAHPARVGSYRQPYSFGIDVSSEYVYLVGDFGLTVLDVSDPANPAEVGAYRPPPETGFQSYAVAVADGHAFMTDPRLRVIDVSNPEHPLYVGRQHDGPLTNRIAASGDLAYLPVGADGLDIVEFTCAPCAPALADLSVEATANLDTAVVGSPLRYAFSVFNNGPEWASNMRFTATFSSGVSIDSAPSFDRWNCTIGAGTVTCERTGLVPDYNDEPIYISVTPTSCSAAEITATVSVTADTVDPGSSNDQATLTIPVKCPLRPANLALGVTGGPTPVDPGAGVSYHLAVHNRGPGKAQNLVVVDTLPPGTTFVRAGGRGWICAFEQATGAVTCTRTQLAVGDAPLINIRVKAPSASGRFTNCAEVSASNPDPNPDNNDGCLTLRVRRAAAASGALVASP